MQKKVPYVAQLGNMDCSIACMTMLFRYYGLDVDIVDVGQVVHIGRDGVNLTQLKQATQQFGFKCTAYRYNKQKNILDSNLPAVVYSGSHLAVIGSKTVLGQYILLDPIKGKSIVNFEQIHDTFSDILITIRPEKRIKRKKCKPKLKVAINYKLVAGIISLMLLIQALTLSIPLVEQALIDSITQSQSLLNSAYILVGCIVIAGLYFFLSIARQKLMLRLDISFVKEIMTKMLKKLFDIDPSFFEWHAVGEIVNRFSKVICDAQQKGGGWKAATVSAPLAGFSHGVAGIVYALNKLYKLYPDKHIKQCIVNGLQYEDELFCEADGNWKDIRKGSTNGKNLCAWCHGAGGILLSRISLLGNIDNETDEIVKEDIRNAVKTMQSHKYLQNPCVCHGIAGNAEILLTYGQQFQDQIASSTAKHFYSRLVGSVNSGTFECSRPYLYGFNIPGFMTGLAGIGYSLLRLLDPTLPSVLQINI